MPRNDLRAIGRRSAVLTVACLGSSVFFVFPALFVVNTFAPAFSQRVAPWLFFALLGVSCAAGGGWWARRITRLLDGAADGRQSIGAALGFGLTAPVAVYTLTSAESLVTFRLPGGGQIPVHVLFAVVFPLATFVVSGATTVGLGLPRGGWRAAIRTGLTVGIVAATSFATVDVAFDLAGMRIGAPGAEKRATMLVVMAVGLLASSLLAGAAAGRGLAWMRTRTATPAPHAPEPAIPSAATA